MRSKEVENKHALIRSITRPTAIMTLLTTENVVNQKNQESFRDFWKRSMQNIWIYNSNDREHFNVTQGLQTHKLDSD